MATYTKETALYDTGAIAGDIADAGTTATNFISADSSGIMVYDGKNGTQTPSNPAATTNNVFIDSDSLDVRRGTDVLAAFGASGAQIGKTALMHIEMDADSFVMGDAQGQEIAHIGSPATPDFTDTFFYSGSAGSSFTVTLTHTPSSNPTVKINDITVTAWTRNNKTIIIQASASLQYGDVVTVTYRTNEQLSFYTFGKRTDNAGDYSFAEGMNTTASGPYSHAEGGLTRAYGDCSHAEGNSADAYAYASHAEGFKTVATGRYAHAEGWYSEANGESSHAQNNHTIANGTAQTAIGKYNVTDTTSLFIIGNGSSSTRSNALTVDNSGNVNIASGAKYKINGTALSASDVSAVPTSRTVNSKALSSNISLTASDVGAVATSSVSNSGAANKIPKVSSDGILRLQGSLYAGANSDGTGGSRVGQPVYQQVTFPFTPTKNGILLTLIQAQVQGRVYIGLSNAVPSMTDGWTVSAGYVNGAHFCSAGSQVKISSQSNMYSYYAYYVTWN